ncbi:biotin-dependent carboxyltransferase family protein [Pacificoceanicola onchidii]|uniref:5-oxoprolinase subunit C family protein n=1 Tax=Pacificoceanicola onchidii TaxID=2562685 RepID=UPI0010A4E633|nr:biotin-dependent carboxyltransferase family protein [Pacificoceanicola onchidii]
MSVLRVLSCGPGVTVQDRGRAGFLAQGLSRGGAVDRLALEEGAALLGQPARTALEMAGMGGRFSCDAPLRIALTGAPMKASLDGAPLRWHASHLLPAGSVLEIGGVTAGAYGYLSVGGGFAEPERLGAQSAHLAAGLGRAVQAGDALALGQDRGGETGMLLEAAPRWAGGEIRILPSLQTDLYPRAEQTRFEQMEFTRDARANRMGARMNPGGAGFGLDAGQTILSEVITPGDIQIPGDGAPYVLLSECQTTGGYPRIGTVIPADLPKVAQAPAGAKVRFRFVSRDEALAAQAGFVRDVKGLAGRIAPLVRDPAMMQDLLSYTLISGMITGEEEP